MIKPWIYICRSFNILKDASPDHIDCNAKQGKKYTIYKCTPVHIGIKILFLRSQLH